MKTRNTMRILLLASLVGLASCGGNSSENGQTIVTGVVVLPNKCVDCKPNSTAPNAAFFLQFLQGDQKQTTISTPTSSAGVYDTGDITGAVANVDPNNRPSFVIIAQATAQVQVGGIVPQLKVGSSLTKDFNSTTQIACVAAVLLTSVPNACPGQPLPTLKEGDIDSGRTDILEHASSAIADQVRFPDQESCAACAVLSCTQNGAQYNDSTAGCVQSQFAACPG
jgi:hypothetical protein